MDKNRLCVSFTLYDSKSKSMTRVCCLFPQSHFRKQHACLSAWKLKPKQQKVYRAIFRVPWKQPFKLNYAVCSLENQRLL